MMSRLLPAVLLLLMGACDPCSGLGSCVAPQVRYEGILTRGIGLGREGPPAAGVKVKFVPTGGISLREDTLFGSSDEEGRFTLEGEAEGEGVVTGELIIYPPTPIAPVRIGGVRMATSRGVGDLRRLGEWRIPFPYLAYQFHVYYRANGEPARGIEVEFRRTSGIPIQPESFRTTVDERGYVIVRPEIGAQGVLIGDLTVNPLPPRQPFTVRGLRLATVTEERFDSVFQIGIGQRLPYSAIVVWANTGAGIEGATVEFRRTGGVPIFPEKFVAKSDRFGTVQLNPTPLAPGEVRGDVVITPPAPGVAITLPDVRLATVEDDRATMLLGYWGVPVKAVQGP
jgi:hypothetical protein